MADALGALIQLAPSITKLATDLISASDTAKRNAQLIEFQKGMCSILYLI